MANFILLFYLTIFTPLKSQYSESQTATNLLIGVLPDHGIQGHDAFQNLTHYFHID